MFGSYNRKTLVRLTVSLLVSFVVIANSLPVPDCAGASYPMKRTKRDSKDVSTDKLNDAPKSSDEKGIPRPQKNRLADLPLSFEINDGQADAATRFLSRGNGYNLYLNAAESILVLGKAPVDKDKNRPDSKRTKKANIPVAVVKMKLADSNKQARMSGLEELKGKTNYFIGNDPAKWRTNVSTYAKVKYEEVYPGIDMVYHGDQENLEYDFVVAGGADPGDIKMQYEGARSLRVNKNGDLLIRVQGGELRQHKPIVYQEIDGQKVQVTARYVLKRKTEVTFEIGAFDRSKVLLIDPQLSYSSYLGGAQDEYAENIAVDGTGNIYVSGMTRSTNFPLANAFQSSHGGGFDFWDAYITKLDPTGSTLIYSTYLGGNGDEYCYGLAVDGNGSAYISGVTWSSNLPTVNPFQSSHGGGQEDVFVTKFNPAGSALVYSTYLGGNSVERSQAMAVDSAGNAYLTGYTSSANFPTLNPFQPAKAGSAEDAYITKFGPTGLLIYSSFLGGDAAEIAEAVTTDSSGNAYVTGFTGSTNFPTVNPRQSTFAGGIYDAFVTKVNPTGTALVYSTYHGGTALDFANSIAVDASGNAYVTGATDSTNFPVVNAFQSTSHGAREGFVSKFNATGNSLLYSTYIGGAGDDTGNAIALDSANSAYIAGESTSTNFPRQIAIQTLNAGGTDGFVAKLDPNGTTLIFSTYLGGAGGDTPQSIAVNANGDAYVTGRTSSTNFPTVSPFQSTNGGSGDGFIVKITGLNAYLIQGHITDALGGGLSAVTVALSGSGTGSVQTDSAGNYTFAAFAGGNYTVTPTKSPYTFVPASQTFNNLSASQTADFTVATHSITGSVTNGGAPVEGVTLVLSGTQSTTTQTDATGAYSFPSVAKGGNYTLTPSKSDLILTYSFVPASQTISNLSANQVINFSASSAVVSAMNSTADAYVQDGTGASTNFGLATSLKVETDSKTNNSKNFDTYLKFDVSGVGSNITSAKLRIFASSSTAAGVSTSAYAVSTTTWVESGATGITWNNKPARGAVQGSATINTTTPAIYDLDVTTYVRNEKTAGRDVISLALHTATSTVFVTLNSREAAANKPQLIVTTSSSANAAPSVALTNPTAGAPFTSPANILVSANATDSDGTISKVDFYSGTTFIGTATTAPYQITWGSVSAGSYSLTAVATDNLSATTVSSPVAVTVSVPNISPTVTLDSSLNGTTFSAGSNIPLVATANDLDGTISKVEFFAGATLVGTATVPSSGSVYTVTWTNVNSGAYALTAKATDNANSTIPSSIVNINVVSQTGLSATADAYVRDGASATTNFGTATELQAQVSSVGSNRETYIKFDITTVTGIVNAKLRLYGRLNDTSGTNVPAAVYPVLTAAPDWVESGTGSITWNNKPGTGAAITSATVTDNTARWYEWNIGDYVQSEKAAGRNIIKLAIKNTATSTPYATFNSKEADNNRPQLVLWTTQARNALFVAATTTLSTADNAIKTRLQNLGYTVTVKGSGNSNAIQTSDATGKTLVLISSTVTSANVLAKFRHVAVPVITWKADLFDDHGMTGSTANDFGTTTGQTQLVITNSAHPLAAGLTGTQTVSTSSTFTWGKPTGSPITIATLFSDATKFVIFAYDNTAATSDPTFNAPARRVGFFMTDLTPSGLNAQGNSLVDAAVKWAADFVTGPVINTLTPSSGLVGTAVTIRGSNFGNTQGASVVSFNGASATPSSWSDTSVSVTVPLFGTTGPVVITVNGVASNGLSFSVAGTDSDGDGLADAWEIQYFGNLNQTANGDPDGDGITNLQEFQQGRNPTKSALADNGDFVNLKIYTPLLPLP